MKIHTFIQYFILIAFLQFAFPQTITNLQQKIENGRIVVTYDLQGKPGESYNINLTVKKEGDSIIPKVIAGDLTDVSPGTHKVIWWEPVLENRSLTGWHITLIAEKPLFNMVYIPGGTFEMGCGSWASDCQDDEKPVHAITVSSFYMGSTEVTQKLWHRVMGSNPSRFNSDESRPVENVSYEDIQKFIQILNTKTHEKFSLPTEAQWEYAARNGGQNIIFPWGNESYRPDANCGTCNSGGFHGETAPVGSFAPNELGLYDMAGNVKEWCRDVYDKTAYVRHDKKNPVYDGKGSSRVVRGGSFADNTSNLRCINRDKSIPGMRSDTTGFRLTVNRIR